MCLHKSPITYLQYYLKKKNLSVITDFLVIHRALVS